jgi:heat shock protein HslJ
MPMQTKWIFSVLIVILLTGCTLPWMVREEPSPKVTLFVGPERVFCDNPLRNNLCYQVKGKPEDQWELYKGEIMGLIYQPDYIYELQVQKDSLSNPTENAPEQQWVLMKIIQKAPISNEGVVEKQGIKGATWTLDQFGTQEALHSAVGDTLPTIFFQENGHFTGSSVCNKFNGSYSIDNLKIQFGSIAITKKMCPTENGMLEQEQTILRTLETADTFEFDSNNLSIFSSTASLVLKYKK